MKAIFRLSAMIFLTTLISNCTTYTPIIDTKGRSGKWNEARATEITDDVQSCTHQAKQHTNPVVEITKKSYNLLLRPKLLWLSPKANDNYKMIMVNCLEGRNHNLLNK